MFEPYLAGLRNLLVEILFLCVAAALISTGLLGSPDLVSTVLVAALVVIGLMIALLVWELVHRPYDRIFESEADASANIESHIKGHSTYEALRIAGASCTSIFSLFEAYVGAMRAGKRLSVCMLDPEANDIIAYLRDCEPDRDQVVQRVREHLEVLRPRVSTQCYDHIHTLVSAPDAYGSKLIRASTLLWREANRIAREESGGQIANGLDVYHYTHLPTLKAWIFGDTVLYIGGYSPVPGGAGINNPIHRLTKRRRKQRIVIQSSRRAFSFLADHLNTRNHVP